MMMIAADQSEVPGLVDRNRAAAPVVHIHLVPAVHMMPSVQNEHNVN